MPIRKQKRGGHVDRRFETLQATTLPYDDLYLTEQPYGFVCGVVTGLPARDSSSAALT